MSDQQGIIKDINISQEMRTSFMDYAMSVIVARALPDVRDGLKPGHRRILYAMNDLGIRADKPHKKSARIVGEVIGKYHPHGDSAVYDTMVRMAQDFSYRYELVDGHGNFGSVDGDSAAAMRYTEARMSKIAMEIIRDINKNTVNFKDNYDGSEREPEVLPSRFPNLLVNGSSGIAVGMATNIPPHQLGEVIDGVLALSHNPDITIQELMQHIPGPDFPTAGEILGRSGIRRAYETGRGSIIVRAKAEIEQTKKDRERIIVTELPYQVNKARLVEKIADLVREKKIEGITDLRDESDRRGMRVVMEIRRDANASVILNNLYKQTSMQTTFGVNMLAIVNGRPRTLTLKEMLYHYLEHQKEIVRRRTQFDLEKAEAREHLLAGLRIALDHLDEVIRIIRANRTADAAREQLMERFALSEKQSQAILDMRLQRLTGLEREKIDAEYDEIMQLITELKTILESDEELLELIRTELEEVKERFNDKRRTEIRMDHIEFEDEDLIPEKDIIITLTSSGYIKRLTTDSYRAQRRGGRGVQGIGTNDADYVTRLLSCSTHDTILFFTNRGKVYRIRGYEVPEMSRTSKGVPIINLIQIERDEKVETMIPVNFKRYLEEQQATEETETVIDVAVESDETVGSSEGLEEPEEVLDTEEVMQDEQKSLIFMTRKGRVKRSPLSAYARINKNGLIAIRLFEDDELTSVRLASTEDEVFTVSNSGKAIRFPITNVRSMGRGARGVKAMNLSADAIVIGMELARDDQDVLVITEKGFGKRTPMTEFRTQSRGGKGLIASKVTERVGQIVALRIVDVDDDIMIMTESGIVIRTDSQNISSVGRNAQGVKVIRIEEGDRVATVAKLKKEDVAEEELAILEEGVTVSDEQDDAASQVSEESEQAPEE
ncbi:MULTISPECIES: DNA gyrase subunit A [Exiguobacterium]|uniref:DNA gyrase subunit A n=1 Tax=Exiguobacterium antarcticum TaxID=132920 RepID=A0ABT6R418_9BACL|nr:MULTISPECIES: DNA gyrase subunit A [Exiguobacterium]AFS69169.1 DNA gyrase subunit A [Exiguobacterium antarcticum B7]MCT4780964.1 DNA gyrase subunit A [Exiguobacterium soli]MDI3235681.1 DNA gyrase subunit A [Exiguobacterium antarcticum]